MPGSASRHAEVRTAVEAMTLGAVACCQKPFGMDELLAHLRRALDRDASRRDDADGRLTPKERGVLDLIAVGKTNKQIAATPGSSAGPWRTAGPG